MSVSELIQVLRDNVGLKGDAGEQLRSQGAAALAGASTEDAHCGTIVETAMGIEVLCALSALRDNGTAMDALSALVNVAAAATESGERHLEAVTGRLIKGGGLKAAAGKAASPETPPAVQHRALMLLQNATRTEDGAEAVAALEDLCGRLVLNFARRRPSEDDDYDDDNDDMWVVEFGACLRNLTAKSGKFRAFVLRRSTGVLKSLLPQLVDPRVSAAKKVAIADSIHHCALAEKDEHWHLLRDLYVAHYLIFALVDDADVAKLPEDERGVVEVPGGTVWSGGKGITLPPDLAARVAAAAAASEASPQGKRRERDPAVTLAILDTLLCFCAKRRGRELLRSLSTYAVVRDTDYFFAGESADTTQEAKSAGVLVTLDETANKDDEKNENNGDKEEDEISDKISQTCSEIADMLQRDEARQPAGDPPLATAADAVRDAPTAPPGDAGDSPPPPPPPPKKSPKGAFDGLKGAFVPPDASCDAYDAPD